MSRFIKKAGESGSGGIDLSNYTGSISASNGYNICNLRSGWERIYYQDDISGNVGNSIEFEVDTSKYLGFCLSVNGLYVCATNTLFTAIGTDDCYCTTIGSSNVFFYTALSSAVCRTVANWCAVDTFGGPTVHTSGGFNVSMCISPYGNGISAMQTIHSQACSCTTLPLPRASCLPNLPWGDFSKFRLCSNYTFCACQGNAVIQLLGMPKLPDIGV